MGGDVGFLEIFFNLIFVDEPSSSGWIYLDREIAGAGSSGSGLYNQDQEGGLDSEDSSNAKPDPS